MTSQLFFLAVYIFEALIAWIYFNDNYKLKKSNLSSLCILFALYIVGFFGNILDHNINVINQIIFFCINLLFSRICFDISLKSSLFHSSFLVAVMSLSELVAEAGSTYFAKIPIDAYKNNMAALFIVGTISKIIYLIICKVVSALFSYKNTTENYRKKDYILFLYPIIVTATLTTYLYASTKYEFSKQLNLAFVIISIVSLFFCCFIFIYNHKIQAQEDELISLQIENQKKEIDQTYMSILEQNNKDLKIFTHDIKNHLEQISNLSDNPEITEYVSKLYGTINQYSYAGISDNRMLDVIIGKYNTLCESKNISISFNVKNANLSFVDNTDLSTILNNLLDNAVETAENSKDRKISVSIYSKSNSMQVLKISNSCDTPPIAEKQKLITSKSNKELHGLGVTSVIKTVKKYDGLFDWSYDKNNLFETTVIFSI